MNKLFKKYQSSLIGCLYISSIAQACQPEQAHITLGESFSSGKSDVKYTVGFIVKDECIKSPYLELKSYGKIHKQLPDYKTIYNYEKDEIKYKAVAYFIDLATIVYDREYEWTIVGGHVEKPKIIGPFQMSLPIKDGFDDFNYIIIGNMDISDDSKQTLDRLKQMDLSTKDALIHLGNFAYKVQDDNGEKGDEYFNTLQEINSVVPYIVTPGSEDRFDKGQFFNFRFKMPGVPIVDKEDKGFKDHENHYFSYNQGNAHFVSINFEYPLMLNTDGGDNMFKWFYEDLYNASVNIERKWIIVFTHHPIICQNPKKSTSAYSVIDNFMCF